jgi:hypothetical protein
VSRTATATLVFTDERHRETWLETHGLVPPKHGAYTGVAERVDYEHRRDQATLVFTIEPDVAAPARAPVVSSDDAVAGPPDDHELPFSGGFQQRRLSTLDVGEILALHNALASLVRQGGDEATRTWLRRVDAWGHFRRVEGGVR